MPSSLRLAAAIAILPAAAGAQATLSAEGIAGVGAQGCETVIGVQNAPVLAAAVDWGLGYMAGRRDAGHREVPGEPLSTTDPADLAVGILRYCRENPYGLVLDALRAYGLRVFAEGPSAAPARQPRLPHRRPPRRPDKPAIAVMVPDLAGSARGPEMGRAGPEIVARAAETAEAAALPPPAMVLRLRARETATAPAPIGPTLVNGASSDGPAASPSPRPRPPSTP